MNANTLEPNPIWQRLTPWLRWPWEIIPLVLFYGWLYRQTMPPGRFTALLENAQNSCARIPEVSRVVAELARAAESPPGATDTPAREDDDS